MFDLPHDPVLKALLVEHYEAGGVLGAVCHGPVAFTGLTNASGARLIHNPPVTAFTNEETRLFGEKWVPHFPFVLEDELVAKGARFAEAEPMMPFVQVGDRIVTGQNPHSTAIAAEAMVRLLGVEPAARDLWADERSLMLVGRLLEGETAGVAEQLAAEPELYDMPLIAMYGYYRTLDKTADAKDLAQGQAVMGAGETLRMTAATYRILRLVAEVYPRTLPRFELSRGVWGEDPPDSDSLRSHVHLLRQVLDKPFAWPMLETVHGIGFRLRAEP